MSHQEKINIFLQNLYKEILLVDFQHIKNGVRSKQRILKSKNGLDIFGKHHGNSEMHYYDYDQYITHKDWADNDPKDILDYNYFEYHHPSLKYANIGKCANILVGYYLPKECPEDITFQLMVGKIICDIHLHPGEFSYAMSGGTPYPISSSNQTEIKVRMISQEKANISDIRFIYCNCDDEITQIFTKFPIKFDNFGPFHLKSDEPIGLMHKGITYFNNNDIINAILLENKLPFIYLYGIDYIKNNLLSTNDYWLMQIINKLNDQIKTMNKQIDTLTKETAYLKNVNQIN